MANVQIDAKLSNSKVNGILVFPNLLTWLLPKVEYPMLPTRTNGTPLPSLGKWHDSSR